MPSLSRVATLCCLGVQVLLELRMTPGQQGVDASFKSENAALASMAFATVAAVLGS